MRKTLIAILIALALIVIPVGSALAATSQNVTVTATPKFISITNTPTDWNIGGTSAKIDKSTTYYSNPLGETTAPSALVADGECKFTITNTSNVAINITVNFPNFTGGDAMTNINTGYANNGANQFGASGYISGMTWPAGAVILKSSASDALKTNLAASTNLKWGIAIKTQSDDWTSGSEMSSTVTVTATQT